MVVDHQQNHLHQLRSALSIVTYPLHYLADAPLKLADWFRNNTASQNDLIANNQQLHQENLRLKAELQKYQALQAENLRLRDLLDSSYNVGERVLITEITAVDLDPYRQQVIVNKGSLSGTYVGQPVLNADAVTGQVTHVMPFSSTVLLITDPSHAIPVHVLRNGLRTIAVGTGKINQLSLPYLPTNSDIQPGDQLYTSGLGGKFPSGYPVATVKHVDRSPDNAFAEITAETTAHLDRSREALLVWSLQDTAAKTELTSPTAPENHSGEEQ